MAEWWKEAWPELLAWLCLAGIGGAAAAALWFLGSRTRRLLPPQRLRPALWRGFEILLIFLVGYFIILFFVDGALTGSGFYRVVYGPEFPLDDQPNAPELAHQLALGRREIWVTTLAFPLQLAVIVLILAARGEVRPYQLGWTRHRLAENVVAGYVFWLLLALPVIALNWLVLLAYEHFLHVAPTEHPLGRLFKHLNGLPEWSLAAISVVVVAPVLEELLFRGLIQGWAMARTWGGNVLMALSLLLAVGAYAAATRPTSEGGASPGSASAAERLAPVFFVVVLIPGYVFAERLTWRWLPQPNAAPAIYSTAVLFALAHETVWPSPIPLFVLGLGLGYLAYRTQSLIGPVVFHALFNAVAAVSVL
jgi:membrane protease YdiL (CAAX protease family)